jgi:hypothetical protein
MIEDRFVLDQKGGPPIEVLTKWESFGGRVCLDVEYYPSQNLVQAVPVSTAWLWNRSRGTGAMQVAHNLAQVTGFGS